MAAITPIDADPQAKTSDDIEARALLGRQAIRSSRFAAQRTTSNGNSGIGGKAVSGGARIRGGAG